jgi:hypothetical protein
MIILVRRDHKERIVLSETVRREKKLAESHVELFELFDIVRLAGAERAVRIRGEIMIVVSVFDIAIDDWHAGRSIAVWESKCTCSCYSESVSRSALSHGR